MPYRIKEFREKQRMTQAELSQKANISRQKLIDLESGKESNTTIATLKKIASALRCTVTDLFYP